MNTQISPLPDRRPTSTRRHLRVLQGGGEPVQLPLAYEWEVAPGVPAVPPIPHRLRVVGPELAGDAAAAALPDPGKWVAQLARAVVEASFGERPAAQLTRWLTRAEMAKLTRLTAQRTRQPGPRGSQRVVRSVRVCPVANGVVETSAVLVGADRAQAIAIRLEAVEGRWLATAIEMR